MEPRCNWVCPHGDCCSLSTGHTGGHNHPGCDCNEPDHQVTTLSVKELREKGLLWQINRMVLHPLGYALSVVLEDDGTERLDDICITSDPEGWIYEGSEGEQKFSDFMQAEGKAKIKRRQAALGYVIQPAPPLPGLIYDPEEK